MARHAPPARSFTAETCMCSWLQMATHSSLLSVPVSLPMTAARSTEGGTLQASSPILGLRSTRPIPCSTAWTAGAHAHAYIQARSAQWVPGRSMRGWVMPALPCLAMPTHLLLLPLLSTGVEAVTATLTAVAGSQASWACTANKT